MDNPVVAIRCITYNHVKYIRECLEGFILQKTNFPFWVIIHDDNSTDGTTDIIKEYERLYPNVIKPIYEIENQWSKPGNPLRKIMNDAIDKSGAKYVALCEGDDYWTDPLKLQKQVDFLEKHEEYSLCCHRYKIYEEDGNVWKPDYVVDLFKQNPYGFTFTSTDNLHHWITKTVTMMYRKSALPEGYENAYRYPRDVHMNYHLLQNGLGYCMPDDMAVYRRHQRGIFSPLAKKEKERINLLIHCEILQNNPNDPDLKHFAKNEVDSYFNQYVKCPIGCHKFSSNTYRDIRLVLNEYRIFNGRFKSVVYILKKCTKAYLKGFKKK